MYVYGYLGIPASGFTVQTMYGTVQYIGTPVDPSNPDKFDGGDTGSLPAIVVGGYGVPGTRSLDPSKADGGDAGANSGQNVYGRADTILHATLSPYGKYTAVLGGSTAGPAHIDSVDGGSARILNAVTTKDKGFYQSFINFTASDIGQFRVLFQAVTSDLGRYFVLTLYSGKEFGAFTTLNGYANADFGLYNNQIIPIVNVDGGRSRVLQNFATADLGLGRVLLGIAANDAGGYALYVAVASQERGIYRTLTGVTARDSGGYSFVNSFKSEDGGRWRVAGGQDGYALYVGYNQLPDFTQPAAAFSTTLPFVFSPAFSTIENTTLYIVVRKRDKYGLESQTRLPTLIMLDTAGNLILSPLTPAMVTIATTIAYGVRLGLYYAGYLTDEDRADTWRVWLSPSGPPDTTLTPTYEASISGPSLTKDFTPLSPGTYYLAATAYRSADGGDSGILSAVVTVPNVLPSPIAMPTELIDY